MDMQAHESFCRLLVDMKHHQSVCFIGFCMDMKHTLNDFFTVSGSLIVMKHNLDYSSGTGLHKDMKNMNDSLECDT